MRWPRGKYNGRRVGGFEVRVRFSVFRWRWLPLVIVRFQKSVHWLGWDVWLSAAYD